MQVSFRPSPPRFASVSSRLAFYLSRFTRRATRSPSERAIALVIVMISIFVLTMLAGGFALSMKVETKLARNANSESELEWLGRSAVECARWELAQYLATSPPLMYDSLDQPWAGGSSTVGISNSPLMDFKHEIQTRNGSATWTIVDLERKANINTANDALLQQALMAMGVDAGQMTPVVNSILDWIDPDENTRVQGAESEFYQSLPTPYNSKNGPIDDLSELLLVKSASELYAGVPPNASGPAQFNPHAGRFGNNSANIVGPPIGLTNMFTALSSGRININTASAEVLQILPGMTPEIAQGIVSGRGGEDDGSGLMGPYRGVQDVRRVTEVPLPMLNIIQQFCDVRSKTFEVNVDAHVSDYHRHFTAVIGRNTPRDVQILTFYWTD